MSMPFGALARTLHAWEQWDAAHDVYLRAQALAPRASEWFFLDGVALQRLARPRKPPRVSTKRCAALQTIWPARAKLAEALLDSGDLDRAEQLYDALRREPRAEPVAEWGLGRIARRARETRPCRHASGARDRAVSRIRRRALRARALVPSAGAPRRGRARARATRSLRPAWPAIDDPALAAVIALRTDPETTFQARPQAAETGRPGGAVDAHEAALARDPSNAQAHDNLSLYGRLRNWAKAEEHYRAVVALGFNLGDAHYDYGVLLGLQEKWDLASEAYRQAIAVNPRHAQAHNNLGQILERQRALEAAAAEYRQAADSQPAFRIARFNLGRMLIALGRMDEAIDELGQLKEPRDVEAPRYLFALATAHVRAGRRDEGIQVGNRRDAACAAVRTERAGRGHRARIWRQLR